LQVEEAFKKAKRKNFVPEELQNGANLDMPLPIGFGQTISQPTTVAMMLDWLKPEEGDKVLDVGSGSGWTTALLSQLVSPSGSVYAVEKIPELLEFGKNNTLKIGVKNAKFYPAGKEFGLQKFAPYDCILVSAAADKVPKVLLDQLAAGGKMVIPVNDDVQEITKNKNNDYEAVVHHGFAFVPLVGSSG
jgi:protein-L-isoaspartate(D-aspartate) O-methyltransferase